MGESGVSGFGRTLNATAFSGHEGLHLEERRPECRGEISLCIVTATTKTRRICAIR